eukprot:gene2229-2747_t
MNDNQQQQNFNYKNIKTENGDSKTIAIIGGGVAGITSCKSALECGLKPTVFERYSTFGGTWSPISGIAWSTLNTNLSKYTFMYSDFPFKKEGSLCPNTIEVYQYLNDYINHFNLLQYFKFNSNVLDIRQDNSNSGWIVEWIDKSNNSGKVQCMKYDFVIIATGFFSEPTPIKESMKEFENFTGEFSFGMDYRDSESFKGKRVAILGSSFTGCEIASALAKNNQYPLHIVYRVHWVIERKVKVPDESNATMPPREYPIDIVFYRRDLSFQANQLPIEEMNRRNYEFFSRIARRQISCPELKVDAAPEDPQWLVVSDGYVDNVIEKKIQVRKRKSIVKIDGKKIYFKNNHTKDDSTRVDSLEEQEIDHIIFCTGYRLKLPFFKRDILDQLYYDENDPLQPVILHKTVFSPNLKNIGFVGIYKGVFLPTIELQSRWICMVFSGILKYPSNQEMLVGIQKELDVRNSYPKQQFPHGDYVQFCENLAKEIGSQPDYENIKSKDPVLYRQLWNNFLAPSSWRLFGFNSDPELAKNQLKEIDKLFYSNK